MNPPCYVSIVLPPHIRLEHVTPALRAALSAQGVCIEKYCGDDTIRFDEARGTLDNPEFTAIFSRLNNAGVCFGEDYKQGWAPADIMRELQERGAIKTAFTAIGWHGPGEWTTQVWAVPEKGGPPRKAY